MTLEITAAHDGITPQLTLAMERTSDMTEPLTAILEDGLFTAQRQVVEGKGALFGGAGWPDMAPYTIEKGRDPLTLLVETGALVLSMSRGAPGNVFQVGATEGVAGTSLASQRTGYGYAAGQHRGAPRANRPPRPYLLWYAERLPDYDRLIAAWILRGAAGNG